MDPGKYLVQIDNFYLNEFMMNWIYSGQPCSLLLLKPRTQGLTAIRLLIDSDKAIDFIVKAQEKTKCKLYKDG